MLRIMHRMRVRLDAAAAVGRLEELVAAPPTPGTSLQQAAGGGAQGDEAALLAGDLQACFARARAVVDGSMSLLDRDALVARLESAADAAEAKLLRTVDEAEAAFKAASSVGSAGMELLLREVARLSGIADQGVATAERALADATTAEPSKYKPLVDNKVCELMHVCVYIYLYLERERERERERETCIHIVYIFLSYTYIHIQTYNICTGHVQFNHGDAQQHRRRGRSASRRRTSTRPHRPRTHRPRTHSPSTRLCRRRCYRHLIPLPPALTFLLWWGRTRCC